LILFLFLFSYNLGHRPSSFYFLIGVGAGINIYLNNFFFFLIVSFIHSFARLFVHTTTSKKNHRAFNAIRICFNIQI
jgi:hypothetical protein